MIRDVYDEWSFPWDPDDYHADLYDIPGSYLAEGHWFWVAETEAGLVGTAALVYHDLIPGTPGDLIQLNGFIRIAGTDCSLERLYVRSSARGLGIGKSLMETTVHVARARNSAMEIWSDKRFVQAHSLYARFGASVVGERICHDPEQSPEWGLILPLGNRIAR